MQIVDFYPGKGCFAPGEPVSLQIELDEALEATTQMRVEFYHLAEPPFLQAYASEPHVGSKAISVEWLAPATPAGYGAKAELLNREGEVIASATTAFDVLASWTGHPRYGFLSAFHAGRPDPQATIGELNHYHINGLQFYDWQYRHDTLLAPTDDYIDPLGRPMSLKIIKSLVRAAHQHGMVAMPYLAVYAASAKFWQDHPKWALYDEDQQPIAFGENFLGLMDPSPGGPWSIHLLREANRIIREMSFDGLHIDQYGNPKQAWNALHEDVDLPQAFVEFIRSAQEQNPGMAVLFNAVGNWPIEALATAPLDFLYIEIWPPEVEYRQLARIVLDAVESSQGKPVVIALYLPADRMANILVADAVILACGGMRIELGEGNRLLADPYFPNHQAIGEWLGEELQRYYDYAVQYGEWLGSYGLPPEARKTWAKGDFNPKGVTLDESVWSVVRQRPEGLCLTLANLNGIENTCWNVAHPNPIPFIDLPVAVKYPHKPGQVVWACPEDRRAPQVLDFEYVQGRIHFKIPQLRFTGVIYIHD